MSGAVTAEKIRYVNEMLGLSLPLPGGAAAPGAAPGGVAPSGSAAAEEGLSGGFFDRVSDLASRAAGAVGDAASTVGDAVVSAADTVGDAVVTAADAVGDAVVTAADAVGDAVVTAADAVGDAVTSAADTVADTVSDTAATVVQGVQDAATAVADTVTKAYASVKEAITGKAPLPPDLPQARAAEKMDKLSPEDRAKVQKLLDGAKSDQEKRYLTKGIAAGHSAAELEAFAAKIAGKDDTWLNDNLRLVGDSKGKGIEQQWSYSCGPTTVEAIKGELDPLYAMKIREENPDFQSADNADGMAKNPGIAADQKAMLVDGKGVATSRDDPEGKGSGLVFSTLLNKQADSTGLVYDTQRLGSDVTVDDAMATMADGVNKGVPVPITVGDAKHPFAHAALVVAVDPGPPRTFTIHDPYYGRTDTFTEDQIKNDQVSVGGWNHVGVVFPPSIKK